MHLLVVPTERQLIVVLRLAFWAFVILRAVFSFFVVLSNAKDLDFDFWAATIPRSLRSGDAIGHTPGLRMTSKSGSPLAMLGMIRDHFI